MLSVSQKAQTNATVGGYTLSNLKNSKPETRGYAMTIRCLVGFYFLNLGIFTDPNFGVARDSCVSSNVNYKINVLLNYVPTIVIFVVVVDLMCFVTTRSKTTSSPRTTLFFTRCDVYTMVNTVACPTKMNAVTSDTRCWYLVRKNVIFVCPWDTST